MHPLREGREAAGFLNSEDFSAGQGICVWAQALTLSRPGFSIPVFEFRKEIGKSDFGDRMSGRLEREQGVGQGDTQEQDGDDHGSDVQFLFNTTAGAIDVAVTTKGDADTAATGLKKDSSDQENCEEKFSDVENHIMHMVTNVTESVKRFMVSCGNMEEESGRSGKVLAAVGVGLVLLLLFAFSWRVFSYYQQIRQGGPDFSNLHFSQTSARSANLAALAAQAPGSGTLATEDDPSLGRKNAAVTVVEFADFGCPFSAEESYVVRALAKEFPDSVRFIYRDFPLDELHPGATLAAEAGNCAMDQQKFWEFHDALFTHQGEFTVEKLTATAEGLGMRADTFETCLTSGKYTHEVQNDLTDGVNAGVVGTPTFFVNGVKAEGAVPYAIFKELLQAFLQK
jgi:protein-disulfide isomerase